jgi:hypothetical protein
VSGSVKAMPYGILLVQSSLKEKIRETKLGKKINEKLLL